MYVRPVNIDETWAKIKAEVVAGRLAPFAKVSTAQTNDCNTLPYVLIVYVPDCNDMEGAMQVRERLRLLGFKRKIPLKTDQMSLNGQSGSILSA